MIYEFINYVLGAVISILVGGITWLIKNVLTNKEEIALLKAEIRQRQDLRAEDREIMQEIKSDLKEVKRDILDLYKRETPPEKSCDQE